MNSPLEAIDFGLSVFLDPGECSVAFDSDDFARVMIGFDELWFKNSILRAAFDPGDYSEVNAAPNRTKCGEFLNLFVYWKGESNGIRNGPECC